MTQLDKDYTVTKDHFGQLSSGSPIQELKSQWINPVPLRHPEKIQAKLPSCMLTLTRPGDISLAEIGAIITKSCNFPVIITPDAQIAMSSMQKATSNTKESDTRSSKDVQKADWQGVRIKHDQESGDSILHGIYWQGNLAGLLDNITTRLRLSWRYHQGSISIFYLDTKNFPLTFMDSKTAFGSTVVSGTSTTSGRGGGTGTSNSSQTTSMEMQAGFYGDLQNTVQAMLTPSMGRMFLGAGMLTVTDTPAVLDTIGRYIEDRNREMNRQVVLNVKVFSVEKRHQDQLGIDWDLVFKLSGVHLSGVFKNTIENGFNGGLTITNGNFKDSKAFVRALAEQANVSLMTQQVSTTTNMSAIPVQVGTQQDYISEIRSELMEEGRVSKSMTKSTITTGFNMSMLPYIMPGSRKVELQLSVNISDDPTLRTFSTGDGDNKNSVELATTRLKSFTQRVILNSNQTLILSGFQQINKSTSKSGVGSASFFGLGGKASGQKADAMLVILITPTLLR